MSLRNMEVQYIGGTLYLPPLEREVNHIIVKDWEYFEKERTCKNNAPDYLDFLCSECGFVHYHSEANDTGEGNEWNYCPNCGARVTPKNSETTPKVVSE